MSSPRRTLSFVIPALNEAGSIGRCVASINDFVPSSYEYEVIVVDNGSVDETAAIAVEAGARVLISDARTIGAVRNEGVAASSGDVLVFLDADCTLTDEWKQGVEAAISTIQGDSMSCTGSQVTPPEGENDFLARHWYVQIMQRTSHLGSGHLICNRSGFLSIEGFDEAFETGEDYDYCQRAMAAGGKMIEVPGLRVEHHDFPRGFGEFLKRERWHGRGDVSSLRGALSSKVALMSLLFTGLCAVAGLAAVLGAWAIAALALLGAFGALVVSSLVKLRRASLATRVAGLAVFAVYYVARTLSVVDVIRGGAARRR